jgi:hypothetical protein
MFRVLFKVDPVTSRQAHNDVHHHLDRERKLLYLFCKQHTPLDVKFVHNAMESFQQKVPPISLGLLKIFSIEK